MLAGGPLHRKDALLLRLATTQRRLARLEAMFADTATFDRLMGQGRYLRLCGAIAMAHDAVDEARARLVSERLVLNDRRNPR